MKEQIKQLKLKLTDNGIANCPTSKVTFYISEQTHTGYLFGKTDEYNHYILEFDLTTNLNDDTNDNNDDNNDDNNEIMEVFE